MQVNYLKKASVEPSNRFLRVAAIDKRNTYCFLYIGHNINSIHFLSNNFTKGITSENFEQAKNILDINKNIDIIIIDMPFEERMFKNFQSYLITKRLLTIPVVYGNNNVEHIKQCDGLYIIDDIIDLSNWQYDFSNKILFLKKLKEYQVPVKKENKIFSLNLYMFKRLVDIIVSIALILLSLPLFLAIALAIRLESKGPILYNSKRAGRGFKIFNFFKFRTMVVNADKKIENLKHLNQYTDGGMFFKISNDPRITLVGKFLRNSSLDELPQLFNVLKGDMSLVGNRPLPIYEAATLTTNQFVERFMAPAGITGLWQIKKRGQAEMSAEERITLDISYARNYNFAYDLWIMINTPKALFQKNNV